MGFDFGLSPEDIKVFLDEVDEIFQLLDEGILKLEQEGSGEEEVISEIFRGAHTLKGSSATLGHQRMAEMTHYLENVLEKLRNKELEINSHLIDKLLETLDALKVFREEIAKDEEGSDDFSELVKELAKFCGEEVTGSDEVTQELSGKNIRDKEIIAELIAAEEVKGNQIFKIDIELLSDCSMPSVRIFQMYEELHAFGKVLYCEPDEDSITRGEMSNTAFAILSSQEPEFLILSSLNSLPDLATVKINNYSTDEFRGKTETDKEEKPLGKDEDTNISKEKQDAQIIDQKSARTVRVDVRRLDKLMNLVGELVISRTQLERVGSQLKAQDENSEITKKLVESSLALGRITNELQEEIVKARMLPIERVFNKFPRMVRDMARKFNKEIEFAITGKETELDRSVIEEIGDPLIHILRNAVDHGVELPDEREKTGKNRQAVIHLSAKHQEGQIVIEVTDDGKGIDADAVKKKAVDSGAITLDVASRMTDDEALQLIFGSGFSTAEEITHYSGRGVGMDIVRTNIEKINGTVDVKTKKGEGSKFTIKLPLTLAIVQSLLVLVNKRIFAVPLNLIVETIKLENDRIKYVNKRETMVVRGDILPLLRLQDVFKFSKNGEGRHFVVIVSFGGNRVGFVVDSLIGEQEIVVKSLGNYISSVRGVSGATILGDGKVALIVDAPSLVESVIKEQNKTRAED